jgi:hypothetical protein
LLLHSYKAYGNLAYSKPKHRDKDKFFKETKTTTIKRLLRRSSSLLTALAFLVATAAPLLLSSSAAAVGQFTTRSLTQSSQSLGSVSTDVNGTAVAPGAGGNGAKTIHTFTFTQGTTGATIGSVAIQYCTTPLLSSACTAPTGFDASTITSVAAISGFAATVPALDTTTVANAGSFFGTYPCSGTTPYRTNCILLKRTTPTVESGNPAFSLTFGTGGATNYIKNPTTAGTFYVRITTFSDNAYSTIVDQAAVAGSANTNIDITSKVQEQLNFSVSATPSAPTTACTALSGSGALSLGDPVNGVLSLTQAYDAHSYFRLNTNAQNGTTVLYSGNTLTTAGGANTIAAAPTGGATSTVGSAQFGLAIDSSDTQSGNGYSFTNLAATTPYAGGAGTITNAGTATFAFNPASVTSPVQIASASAGTAVNCDTGSVRYIGNIGTTTKAGVYRTTIAYIAVPTF